MQEAETLAQRTSPLNIDSEEFRAAGHLLVDRVADFFRSLPQRAVTTGESPSEIRQALGADRTLPRHGVDAGELLNHAASLLFDHSLFNAHPRFWGYVTSSAAPIGALGELLAAAVNPNCGAWLLSPMASEIEAQTIRWVGGVLGHPTPRAPGQGRQRCAQQRRRRLSPARVLLEGDAPLDSEGRGHCRSRHRCCALDWRR